MKIRPNRLVLGTGFAAILLVVRFGSAAVAPVAGPPSSIVLPTTLVAEAPATLAVLDAGGRLVAGAVVALSDGHVVKTDATGRARLVVPATLGEFEARIQGHSIVATAPIVAGLSPETVQTDAAQATSSAGASPTTSAASEIQLTDFPEVVDARDRFAISGTRFLGDADENSVSLGGKSALVLAASPSALVLLPSPDTPLGAQQLRIQSNGHASEAVTVTVVELDAIQPAGPLRVGQQAILTVRVRGTAQPLDVELGNWSPATIKLVGQPSGGATSGAEVQRVRTSGGEQNEAQVAIVPLSQGKFYVHARLARPRQ